MSFWGLPNFPVSSGCLSEHYKLTNCGLIGRTDWTGLTDGSGYTLAYANVVAMAYTFGIPSDILIWPHFHSQATVPFVLTGVCWGCVNLLISDGAKTALIGGSS